MERLTIIDGCGNDELARCMNCGLGKAGENLENCGMCEEGWQRALRRLSAYEDTGLEPEEIYEVRFLIAAQRDPQKLARLRELVLADQDGRLHITPAFVWHNGDSGLHEVPYKPWMAQWIATGTKFWMTREEAEAALALKGGEG